MPYWGGGTFAARGRRANELMYYALMGHARSRGCTRFDFGRSKLGSGPFSYKKTWGFEPRPLGYARWLAPGRAPPGTHHNSARSRLPDDTRKKLTLRAANRTSSRIQGGTNGQAR